MQRLVEDPVASVRHAVAAHWYAPISLALSCVAIFNDVLCLPCFRRWTVPSTSLCTLIGGGRLGEQWSTWIVNVLHTFLRDDDGAVCSAAIDAVPYIFLLVRGFAHRYVYHAYFGPPDALDSATADGEAASRRRPVGSVSARTSATCSVVPWSEVELLIGECCSKSGSSDAAIVMAVNSMKRTASMVLPALLRISQEGSDEVRCKIATAVGRILLQVRDEFSALELGGWGDLEKGRGTVRGNAWKSLRHDLTMELVAPLIQSLLGDSNRAVSLTLFSEMAGLPVTFGDDGSVNGAKRRVQPMSSIFKHSDEILNASQPAPNRRWTTVEVSF